MNDADLRTEAIVFGRYLVGEDPPAELVERYCRANAKLFPGADDTVVAYARQHPWTVPMLDAAAGITEGGTSLLRKKLLVMTAIVETTPALVERTEQRAVGLPRLALRVGAAGARTAFHVVTGLALRALVKRR